MMNMYRRPIVCLVSIVTLIGCSETAPRDANAVLSETEQTQNAEPATTLPDIGEPDDEERMVDDILIVGSALTDDHVSAIRLITDDDAPTNAKADLIRNIQHTGPNTVLNIWQGRHFESYQTLILVDGTWRVDERGGGFGTFQ